MYCGRTDADTTIFTCPALYEGSEYYFKIYAENKCGRSKPLESEIAIVPKRIFGEYLTLYLKFTLDPLVLYIESDIEYLLFA